ncbi:MAG: Hpt domain-containing protein [Bryobacterales bacterium]|nr:Hpt domain-containing protein [Bryobacterales bacterium]
MSSHLSPELLSGFAAEVTELVVRIAANAEQVRMQPQAVGHLEEARRAAHQAKGAASMIGLSELAHVFFYIEDAIERIRSGRAPWTATAAQVFETCALELGDCLSLMSRGILPQTVLTGATAAALDSLRGPGHPAAPPAPSPRAAAAVADDDHSGGSIPAELLEVFRLEADEHLAKIGECLGELSRHPEQREHLLEVRRSVHTLKGASGSVGFRQMSKLAHRMEDLLDRLSETGEPLTAPQGSLLVSTLDALRDMAEGGQHPAALKTRLQGLYERYDALEPAAAAHAPAAVTPASAPPRAAAPPRAPLSTTPGLSSELIESFKQETEERLQAVQEQLRLLEANPADADLVLAIRRTLHTVKGASAMVGHAVMSRLAHKAEDLLDGLNAKAIEYDDEARMLLYLAADALTDLAATAGGPHNLGDALEEIEQRFDDKLRPVLEAREAAARQHPVAPLGEEPAIELPAAAEAPAPATSPSPSGTYVRVPIERLDELVRFVSELVVSRSTFEQSLGAYSAEVGELDLSLTRLRRISQRLDSDVDVSPLRNGLGQLAVRGFVVPQKADKRQEFDLLEFDRYTDLHLVSRDLSETAVDVSAAASELRARAGDFDSYLNRLSRLTSDIQDRLMRMRMVPLVSLSTRLHRTVRVTAERTGKQVDFVLEGDRVELDKTVLEEMAGPIEHALRNAIDHGIESDVLRAALGKPARGRIALSAHYEGTQVVISIVDDGAGINPDLIRATAVDRGLVTEAEAAKLPDERALDLLFQPGFSTARQVSEVSGRGVGMDVVKSTVTRLKGTVDLTSTPGRGTRLLVRLPMTLAIMRVILLKAHTETFALPANVVTRILRAGPESIEQVGGKTVLRSEGVLYPLLRLGDVLHLKKAADQTVTRHPVLILQIGDEHVALLVDEITDAREVVVKTMGNLLRRVQGFTGATLMGDGSVVLILNPPDLVGARQQPVRPVAPTAAATAFVHRPLEVMTVDDSVSVRRVLGKLIENTGWKPTPAKDGVEALEILQRGFRPDAILLDVEMPRMDVYELLAAVRSLPDLRHIPVVMLTSRAGEKHRKKAFELGATDYLVKPYQDDTLVAVLRRVVREAKEAAIR